MRQHVLSFYCALGTGIHSFSGFYSHTHFADEEAGPFCFVFTKKSHFSEIHSLSQLSVNAYEWECVHVSVHV